MQVINEQSEQSKQSQQPYTKKRNIKMRTVMWNGDYVDKGTGNIRRSSFSITIPINQARALGLCRGDIMSCHLKTTKGGSPYLIIKKLDIEGEDA